MSEPGGDFWVTGFVGGCYDGCLMGDVICPFRFLAIPARFVVQVYAFAFFVQESRISTALSLFLS